MFKIFTAPLFIFLPAIVAAHTEAIEGSLSFKDLAESADRRTVELQRRSEVDERMKRVDQLMKENKWFHAREALRELTKILDPQMQGQLRVKELEITLYRLNYTSEGFSLLADYATANWDRLDVLHQLLQVLFTRKSITAHLHPDQRWEMGQKLVNRVHELVNKQSPEFSIEKAYAFAPGLAQFYFESDKKTQAIEAIEAAINSLKSLPPPIAKLLLNEFVPALAEYKDEKVCIEEICAAPPKKWGRKHDCEMTLLSRP